MLKSVSSHLVGAFLVNPNMTECIMQQGEQMSMQGWSLLLFLKPLISKQAPPLSSHLILVVSQSTPPIL